LPAHPLFADSEGGSLRSFPFEIPDTSELVVQFHYKHNRVDNKRVRIHDFWGKAMIEKYFNGKPLDGDHLSVIVHALYLPSGQRFDAWTLERKDRR